MANEDQLGIFEQNGSMEDEDKANLQKKVAELEENISQLNGSNNNLVQTIQEQDQYIAKLEKKKFCVGK